MSLAVFVLILSVLGFGGTLGLSFALATGMVEGFMKDFVVLNLIGAAHLLLLALIGGIWLIG